MSEVKPIEEVIKEKMSLIVTKLDEKADNAEIQKLKLELEDLRSKATDEQNAKLQKSYDELNEVIVKQGEELKKIKLSKDNGEKAKSVADHMVEAFKANIDKIKQLKGQGMIELELKLAETMTTSNYTTGTVGLSDLEPGFTRIQRRSPFLRQLVNSGTTNSKYVVWVEQANADPGAAGMTGEGSDKTQTDFDIVENSLQTRKITAYVKVSKEMLDDISFVEAEIRGELIELVQLKLDEQILSGDNTGNNLKGIMEYATAYAAGSFAATIDNANNFDVIRTAIAQIEAANFMPNYIVVNPLDVATMELTKATDGHYVLPPFVSATGTTIKGLPVISNNGVTAGDFLVGDFTKSNLRIREDVTLAVGYENDDFTKNLVTILAEARAVHFIKSNQTGAFVTGTFTAAKTALEKP